MDNIYKQIKNDIYNNFNDIIELRRYFHQYPELSNEEYKTADKIEEELNKIGIKTKRVNNTSVYGEIIGNELNNKTIVLRADIDALPLDEKHQCDYQSKNKNVMHACGHDAHIASLIFAAKILYKYRSSFNGKIILFFQQAEEIGYGANVFINEGYLENVNRIFGIHVASNIDCGKVAIVPGINNASVDWFKITINGKSSHVSTPEEGVDALYIASQIVIQLQSIVSRMTNPLDPIILGIGKLNAGVNYNIIASEAIMEGTLRTLNIETRKKCKKLIEKITNELANIYGSTVNIEWKDYASPLINDTNVTKEVQEIFIDIFGKENLIDNRTPSLLGDDFAQYLLHVPGCYAYVGTRNEKIKETAVPHHNEYFDIDESSLLISSTLYAIYALFYLKRNEL